VYASDIGNSARTFQLFFSFVDLLPPGSVIIRNDKKCENEVAHRVYCLLIYFIAFFSVFLDKYKIFKIIVLKQVIPKKFVREELKNLRTLN